MSEPAAPQASTLGLRWRSRVVGDLQTPRRYLDFIVDGSSLQDRLRAGDVVTGLGCWLVGFERKHIRQLLAQAPAESPSGRVPIYVCAECGGLGCGAITAIVERTTDAFVWRDFVFENDYDDEMTDRETYRGVGPFRFDPAQYARLLNERADSLLPAGG